MSPKRLVNDYMSSELKSVITGAQIRAARNALGWSAQQLAEAAGLGLSTIQRAEKGSAITNANMAAIRAALGGAGVEFVAADGATEGVRWRVSAST
jgi:transcriptional regulator with XRE-family HTH domain